MVVLTSEGLSFGTRPCIHLPFNKTNLKQRNFSDLLAITGGLSSLVSHILFPVFLLVQKKCINASSAKPNSEHDQEIPQSKTAGQPTTCADPEGGGTGGLEPTPENYKI